MTEQIQERQIKGDNQVLKIGDLVFEDDLYPRTSVWWGTVYRYSEEMKAGSKFPPIIVGKVQGRLYVVDGWHRCQALLRNGEEYVNAIVVEYTDFKALFVDAVILNSSHGRQFTSTDKVRVISKLEDFKIDIAEISGLVKVPMDNIGRYQSRIVRGPKGTVILKSIIAKQVEKGTLTVDEAVLISQHSFVNSGVMELLIQLIDLIEGEAFPWQDEAARGAAETLYGLLGGHIS